jgi:hypothetical protein
MAAKIPAEVIRRGMSFIKGAETGECSGKIIIQFNIVPPIMAPEESSIMAVEVWGIDLSCIVKVGLEFLGLHATW